MKNTYDSFSNDYDRFVNWSNRLGFEMPFIDRALQEAGLVRETARVLDAACGTGMHAIALAKRGYRAAGADISAGMVARARDNAVEAGLEIPFTAAGFSQLAAAFRQQSKALLPFDALLCLGNSLPHMLTTADLVAALVDFHACLRPGGLLLVQNRNFDAVLKQRERWIEPQGYREHSADGEKEWIFLRFYDYRPDGLIDFNIVTLYRVGQSPWRQQVTTTQLYPLQQAELERALEQAGFVQIIAYGGMDGSLFNADASGNLVIIARRI
jgi:SAM-dependent methyltransferase